MDVCYLNYINEKQIPRGHKQDANLIFQRQSPPNDISYHPNYSLTCSSYCCTRGDLQRVTLEG